VVWNDNSAIVGIELSLLVVGGEMDGVEVEKDVVRKIIERVLTRP